MLDTKSFLKEKFKHRTKDVPVPDLKKWFPKKEKPIWTVRGLGGKEIGHVKEAAAKNKSVKGIIEMLTAGAVTEKTEAMKAVMDLGDGYTNDTAERLSYLCEGTVGFDCKIDLAIKLCKSHPVIFYNLTTEILRLTGQGMLPGEPKKSGKKPT